MSQHSLFVDSGGKLLTFEVGNQEYGVQILEAREVVGILPFDPIPNTPDFMEGVINLRGKIIPVINLRSKFKLPNEESTKENCIIVVNIDELLTGIVVDALLGVLTIEPAEFEESPDLGKNIRTDFITGIAKLEDRIITILNMQKILSNEELLGVQATAFSKE